MRDGELGVEMKAGNEPVTRADKAASALIVGAAWPRSSPRIRCGSPKSRSQLAAGLVRPSARLWLVDPIDGTKAITSAGNDGFSVMIGLVVDGRPVVGVVYQPTLDRLFYASPETGARVVTHGVTEPIHVSDVASAGAVRFAALWPRIAPRHDRSREVDARHHRRFSTSARWALPSLIAMGVPRPLRQPDAEDEVVGYLRTRGDPGRKQVGDFTDVFGDPVDYRGEPHAAARARR